jgi:hypothetical protein
MLISGPGPYSINRLIEWFFASLMVGNALAIAASFGQEQFGVSIPLAALGIGDMISMFGFAASGSLRFAALYANGRWHPYGYYMRMGGSLVGALVWGNMGAVVTYYWFATGTLYRSAIVFYIAAAIFEILSLIRAANDSRIGSIKP